MAKIWCSQKDYDLGALLRACLFACICALPIPLLSQSLKRTQPPLFRGTNSTISRIPAHGKWLFYNHLALPLRCARARCALPVPMPTRVAWCAMRCRRSTRPEFFYFLGIFLGKKDLCVPYSVRGVGDTRVFAYPLVSTYAFACPKPAHPQGTHASRSRTGCSSRGARCRW